ncbi:MAG: V-type ATP synthase subunit D [Candidatus Omnitrophica bacterium]|jgi:V/A-type H+-transporting ATPase subunit D|nr:V-type ATP synthase subunit D [Candidatus Omnitrophota bacterium]
MAKVRLVKSELKNQRDALFRFRRYLPMLQLKKKQLQLEIIKVHQAIKEIGQNIENLRNSIIRWVDVFAQNFPLDQIYRLKEIKTTKENIAGLDLPKYLGVEFEEKKYDLLTTPFWVDKALAAIKEMTALKSELLIYHQELNILKEELRITTQRVNLFEKIKIPAAQDNIRIIQIYLGELKTAEVVRGKIAKAKLEKKRELVGL